MVSVSGIIAPFINFYYWGFLSLRFAQLASVLGTITNMKRWKVFSGTMTQVVVMSALFISLIFSITGLVFTYENVYFTSGTLSNYFVALYMIGITMTTVGYGDFSPLSHAGRIVIILGVLAALWIIPYLIAAVIDPWKQYRATRKYSGSGHAVIFSRSENVQTIVEQFYRTSKTVGEDMLLMTPTADSQDLKALLRSEFLRLRVTHFHGDWSSPSTVTRAVPQKAHFVLLVQNKCTDDAETADSSMVAGALAVLRVSKSVPLFMQLNSASRRFAFDHNRENIICMEDLRRGLLVLNCTAPGVLSVFSNLIISKPGPPKKHKKSWLAPYKNGLYAKFETDVPLDSVIGHSWTNVCKALHALHSITLLSVWTPTQGLLLFPLNRIIEEGDVGQFIHDLGRSSITSKLASEDFQKYLVMLKASAQINDVDNTKVLSLADMLDSEDENLVKKFNLYQRSNFSDVLSASRSPKGSEESREKISSSRTHTRHKDSARSYKGEDQNDDTAGSDNSTDGRLPSSRHGSERIAKDGHGSAKHGSAKTSRKNAAHADAKDDEDHDEKEVSHGSHLASSHHTAKSSITGEEVDGVPDIPPLPIEEVQQEDRMRSLGSDRNHSARSGRLGMDAGFSGGRSSFGTDRRSSTGPEPNSGDPFMQTLVELPLLLGQDEVRVEIGLTWDQVAAKRLTLEGKLTKHLIVCGRADEMTTSIGRRLHRRAPEQQDIVLLVSRVGSASQKVIDEIAALAAIDRFYVIIGQSISPIDLRRAAAPTARVCLVLPEADNLSDETVQASQDSNMIITYHLLRQTDVFPIIELINPENEQLMAIVEESVGSTQIGQVQASIAASLSAAKLGSASGNIFRRSLFDNILAQAVFKPHLIPLFEELADATVSHLALKRFWDDIRDPDVPSDTVLFGQVFSYVIEQKNCLAIAIYRKRADAQDQWVAKQLAKNGKTARFPLDAGRAFRAHAGNIMQKGDERQPRMSIDRTDDTGGTATDSDVDTLQGSDDSHGHHLPERLRKLREKHKEKKRKKQEAANQGQRDIRIAINNPSNSTVMLRSDIIFVIEFNRRYHMQARKYGHGLDESSEMPERWR